MAVSSTSFKAGHEHRFKEGNKASVGHGCPPTYDKEEWRQNLLEWAKKDNSHKLSEFCATHWIDPKRISDWAKECPRFAESLRLVKSIIADRRELYMNTGSMNVACFNRYQRLYDFY